MKRASLLIGVFVLLLQIAALLTTPVSVSAAACSNVSSFGAVRLYLDELQTNKDYTLWVRMQASEQPARLMIELNGSQCLEIKADNTNADQWFWQAYNPQGTTDTLRFINAEGNAVKVIGIQAGVKVDKLLLTEPGCVPQDFGTNCKSAVVATGINDSSTTVLPPVSQEAVSGKIVLSTTPSRVQADLRQLDYIVAGRTIQTTDKPEPFDTTLIENGKHTVLIESTLTDGTVIKESTVVEINNPQNALSPLIRWIRLNERALTLTVISAASIIIVLLLVGGLKGWLRKRRQLHFHGF